MSGHPVGSIRGDWGEDRTARACLTGVVDPADPRLVGLLRKEGAPAVWEALRAAGGKTPWQRRAEAFDLDRSLSLVRHADLRFLVPGDPGWPTSWQVLDGDVSHRGMGGSPVGIWVTGPADPARLIDRSITVVGSRAATRYGTHVAGGLGADLAELGWTVLSGGAYGIDASAHRGALTVDGATVAVLAGGLDQWYPRGNSSLLEQVAANHLVISEVAPGGRPTKKGFLARNRLLAAGGRVTVLVEAAHRSGALNTVGWAHEMVRTVMAVPGPVTSALSQGPNDLVRNQQATLVCTAAQVVHDLVIEPDQPRPPAQPRLLDGLDHDELAVREALPCRGSLPAPMVAGHTGMTVPEVLGALAALELQGLVKRLPDGTWALARPRS
ncbi:DNA-processing protein DprA [Propionibacteriaceae bacterium Y1923]